MNSFYVNSAQVSWFDNDLLSIFQTSFDATAYDDGLITELNPDYHAFIQKAVTKRKSEFVAGRFCALKSLQKWGIGDAFIPVGEKRSPVWPSGIIGSISHCQSYAMAVTTQSRYSKAVGIDVEDMVEPEMADKLQDTIINPDELVLQAGIEPPNVVFTLIFSMKESFFKAVYPHVGYYFDFSAISLQTIDWHMGRAEFKINQNLSDTFKTGDRLSGQFKMLEDKKIVTLIHIKNNPSEYREP
ncbi:4'-phosphopantetheinyl transferase family protein [Gynuella sunshinyii]|uniref:Enterobactin synthase component D n=1 Tax=Gynuella sunshinyii YC6258 TaxID=1445510 RepID=A0A0C5VQC2_9GAMM|nr:4'-phosphopantetheinyl transferase superfamily protein [Gynuella sunshinyii]AJQ95628.1 phosphopantetheinyl transferase component of siderophore synthetase [Gynuella sunshinyii YC6258]